jgi:glycosyltransferase involved in cell wall biosynthesis
MAESITMLDDRDASAPFFTVVIPTFRRPEFLREAVASVLSQTFTDFELIVVDDDPEGSAREALTQFDDPRLHYLRNDRRRGGAGTRNAGIFRAKGKWIAFLDDDDVWLPKKLELQHRKVLEVESDVGLIYTGFASYDFDTRRVIATRHPRMCGWIFDELLYTNHIGGLFSVAVRSDLLKEIGGFDERFPALQDIDLYVSLSRHCKVAYVDEVLVWARKEHEKRITNNPKRKLEGNKLFWQKYHPYIRRNSRLSHRTASRVFVFALLVGDITSLIRSAPWTVAGLVVDCRNFRDLAKQLGGLALRSIRRILGRNANGQAKQLQLPTR